MGDQLVLPLTPLTLASSCTATAFTTASSAARPDLTTVSSPLAMVLIAAGPIGSSRTVGALTGEWKDISRCHVTGTTTAELLRQPATRLSKQLPVKTTSGLN